MKNHPILFSAVALTLIFEIVLIVLVYNKIGAERLPGQITRLTFQVIFILLLFSPRFNWGLFLLSAYHVISGLIILARFDSLGPWEQTFGFYHLVIGLIIYFHDWIEEKLIKKELKTQHNNT